MNYRGIVPEHSEINHRTEILHTKCGVIPLIKYTTFRVADTLHRIAKDMRTLSHLRQTFIIEENQHESWIKKAPSLRVFSDKSG